MVSLLSDRIVREKGSQSRCFLQFRKRKATGLDKEKMCDTIIGNRLCLKKVEVMSWHTKLVKNALAAALVQVNARSTQFLKMAESMKLMQKNASIAVPAPAFVPWKLQRLSDAAAMR